MRPLQHGADVADHDRALFLDEQEPRRIQLLLQVLEQTLQFRLVGGPGFLRHCQSTAAAIFPVSEPGQQPFIADTENRLRQVERVESRVHRRHHHGVAKHQVVVLEALGLAPEQHPGPDILLAPRSGAGHEVADFGPCLPGREDALGHIAGPGRGGEDAFQVGDGVGGSVENPRPFHHLIGAGGGGRGFVAGPAVAGLDQAKLRQPAIAHGAGDHADVLAQLRFHQDDDRAGSAVAGHQLGECFSSAPSRNSL